VIRNILPQTIQAHDGGHYEKYETLLLQWGIRPLHLITGQEHHFVWRIARASELAGRIANLCPAPELLADCEQRVPPGFRTVIDCEAHRAFAAIGLLMEYVAHRVKAVAASQSQFPLEITVVHVLRNHIRRGYAAESPRLGVYRERSARPGQSVSSDDWSAPGFLSGSRPRGENISGRPRAEGDHLKNCEVGK